MIKFRSCQFKISGKPLKENTKCLIYSVVGFFLLKATILGSQLFHYSYFKMIQLIAHELGFGYDLCIVFSIQTWLDFTAMSRINPFIDPVWSDLGTFQKSAFLCKTTTIPLLTRYCLNCYWELSNEILYDILPYTMLKIEYERN